MQFHLDHSFIPESLIFTLTGTKIFSFIVVCGVRHELPSVDRNFVVDLSVLLLLIENTAFCLTLPYFSQTHTPKTLVVCSCVKTSSLIRSVLILVWISRHQHVGSVLKIRRPFDKLSHLWHCRHCHFDYTSPKIKPEPPCHFPNKRKVDHVFVMLSNCLIENSTRRRYRPICNVCTRR